MASPEFIKKPHSTFYLFLYRFVRINSIISKIKNLFIMHEEKKNEKNDVTIF